MEKIRAGANITLDASDSSGPDGEIKEYRWDFGDGNSGTTNDSATEYSWPSGGYYNVTLIVVDENDKTGELTEILQVVPEDYVDEGEGNELVDGVEDAVTYDMEVEIFVESIEIEFSDINCVGFGGQLDYSIIVQDASGESIGEGNGNIACGGDGGTWNQAFSNVEELNLGDYQATIEFTNGGTPVQASWNYRFVILYEF